MVGKYWKNEKACSGKILNRLFPEQERKTLLLGS